MQKQVFFPAVLLGGPAFSVTLVYGANSQIAFIIVVLIMSIAINIMLFLKVGWGFGVFF